jgi:transcriptional regulator with XRE-family HTH domain
MKKAMISPKILKELRERKGWSQRELADHSKVTSRTILAVEKSDSETVTVQHKTLSGICKALAERPDVLSGKEPLPEEGKPFDLRIQLSPQVRLNFDLIKRKYPAVDIQDVINIAPLLFVAAAEESLLRQQEQVEKDAKEYGKHSKLMYEILNLSDQFKSSYYALGPDAYMNNDYFAARWDAVKIKDLFEGSLWDQEWYDHDLPRSKFPNPFADFLYEVSQRAFLNGTIEFPIEFADVRDVREVREVGPQYGYSYSEWIPDHRVCVDILKQITLGSSEAEKALEQGVVSISEIPPDLWEPRKAGERVVWLEEKYRHAKTKEDDEPAMSEEELVQPSTAEQLGAGGA